MCLKTLFERVLPIFTHRSDLRSKLEMSEQYVLLTYDFVKMMRHSKKIATIHAKLEFAMAPEEFFYYIAMQVIFPNKMMQEERVDNHEMMFKKWPKVPNHPMYLTYSNLQELEELRGKRFLFFRKVLVDEDMPTGNLENASFMPQAQFFDLLKEKFLS